MKVEKLLGILEELDELYQGCCSAAPRNTIEVDADALMDLIENVKELILKVRI